MAESVRGRCVVAWFVAVGVLASGPAFAGPDPDGAIDALISTPLDPLGNAFGAIGLIIAALIWAITGYMAYWEHVEPFSKWKPVQMQYQIEMNQK